MKANFKINYSVSIVLMVGFLMAFSHNTIKSIKSKLVYVENTIDNADDAESDDDVMKKELDVDGFFDGFSQISFNRYFESSQIWKIMRESIIFLLFKK